MTWLCPYRSRRRRLRRPRGCRTAHPARDDDDTRLAPRLASVDTARSPPSCSAPAPAAPAVITRGRARRGPAPYAARWARPIDSSARSDLAPAPRSVPAGRACARSPSPCPPAPTRVWSACRGGVASSRWRQSSRSRTALCSAVPGNRSGSSAPPARPAGRVPPSPASAAAFSTSPSILWSWAHRVQELAWSTVGEAPDREPRSTRCAGCISRRGAC